MTQTTRTTTHQAARTTKRARAPRPVFKPQIRLMPEPETYWVQSERHPESGHKTTPDWCTCPAGRFGRLCKHRRLVQAYHAWRMQQLAAAQQPVAQPSAPVQTTALKPLHSYFE